MKQLIQSLKANTEDGIVLEVLELCEEIILPQKERAKTVFDALTSGLPELQLGDGEDYLEAFEQWLNSVIRENLDANSIHHFLLLCGVQISDVRDSLRKQVFSEGGLKGAKVKNALSSELKAWALQEGKKIKGLPAAKARALMRKLPADLLTKLKEAGDKLKDPERVIREALAAQQKNPIRLASQT